MGWGVNEKQSFNHKKTEFLLRNKKKKRKSNINGSLNTKKNNLQNGKIRSLIKNFKIKQISLSQSQRKEEEKRLKELQKKQQLKELVAKQEQQMEKISKKKQQFETKKLTQAEILMNQQRKLAEKEKGSSSDSEDEENPNLATHDFEVAQNVEQALNALNLKDEKHPQKRFKAAFEQFCDKRQPTMKLQNPTLKRTQRMQLLRKQFDKHPDNPFNRANKAYNEK